MLTFFFLALFAFAVMGGGDPDPAFEQSDPNDDPDAADDDQDPSFEGLDDESAEDEDTTEATEDAPASDAEPTRTGLGGFRSEQDVPPELRERYRAMMADYTRKTQELAAERERLAAEREMVAAFREAFPGFPEDPREVAAAVRQAAAQGSLEAPPPAQAEPQDPLANDPQLAHLYSLYEEAVESYDEGSFEARMAAENVRTYLRQQEIEGRLSSFEQSSQQEKRASTQNQQLSSLKADPDFKPILGDPANERKLLQYAARTNLPLDQAAEVVFGRELRQQKAAAEFTRGRRTQEKSRGALSSSPRSTSTVHESKSPPPEIRAKGAHAVQDWYEKNDPKVAAAAGRFRG